MLLFMQITLCEQNFVLCFQIEILLLISGVLYILYFFCLYTYEFWLSLWKIVRSSVILLLPLFSG
jgi:hypothetical protein